MLKFLGLLIASTIFNIAFVCSSVHAHNSIKITFVNPDSNGHAFWGLFTEVMKEAASDLNIDLTVLYSRQGDRFEYMDLVASAVTAEPKPDYLITIIKRHSAEKLMETVSASDVDLFTVNTAVSSDELARVQTPRQRYPNWIGQMLPDDEHAGYLLAKTLIDRVQRTSDNRGSKIKILGLSGSRDSSAASERNLGLKRAMEESPNTELTQLVFTDWRFETAANKTSVLLKRYPGIDMIWAASDMLSLGAHSALQKLGKPKQGKVLTGGIDWSEEGLQAVSESKLAASVGGHFLEGAMALVLLYDHFHGKDFADNVGTLIRTKYGVVTLESNKRVAEYIKQHKWTETDFTKFSQVHDPNLSTYNLNVESLLR